MKYLKTYESKNNDVKINDYVIINFNFRSKIWSEYVNNHIGKITNTKSKSLFKQYQAIYEIDDYIFETYFKNDAESDIDCVQYDGDNKYIIMNFNRSDILYHSKNKKELEAVMLARKFNL